jgi:ribosomal-protein-alanine N-acetyltransferase
MKHLIEIITPRLVLKSITPNFINEIFAQQSIEEIKITFGIDDAGYQNLKNMYDKGMETDRLTMFYFLLIDKANKQVIGECGYHTWNTMHRHAELFYRLRNDEHKRKGLMTEALEKVLKHGFSELNLHRIEALVDCNNTASKQLLKHYGFTKEGTLREDYIVDGKYEDSDCYSLLKWEWQK